MNRELPLVLGIESSCDETGVGIVRGDKLLANTVSSSMEEHVRFGGVIPEIASRAHLDAMVPTLRQALGEAGVALDDIDAIAVTSGPGLAGALMVEEAGGAVSRFDGSPLLLSAESIVACGPRLHPHMLEVLRDLREHPEKGRPAAR